MKKYITLLFALLVMAMPLMGVDAKSKKTTTVAGTKANLYVFYADGCPVCANLHKYISDTLSKDKKHNYMYELVDLNAANSNNNSLLDSLSKKLEFTSEQEGRVPVVVVGETYFVGFDPETSPKKIEAAIEKAYKEKQEDVVASVSNGQATATVPDKELKEEMSTDTTGTIILAIIGVIVVALIIASGKNKKA